ncbi:MAG: polysaccharide biosynthesis/export family protein [Pyrinomonadaceae bacterium]
MQGEGTFNNYERPTIAQRTFKIAKNGESHSIQPTEIYKVGVGDVLFVNLKNSAQGSRYCTVQPDGTIDFPLTGENLIVANQTVDAIEEMLASGITLFSDPQVEVKVREYSSHKITVSGMVEHPGEKSLQREAMPLFVIRSEAVANPAATKVVIKRAPLLKLETYNLNTPDTDNILIYPGNAVEFTGDGNSLSIIGSYYIAGEVEIVGQKQLTAGLTLYQAMIVSGGAKDKAKKATIRRKNEKGVFANTEYNLRSIKDGKKVDPLLEAGDVIEIRK